MKLPLVERREVLQRQPSTLMKGKLEKRMMDTKVVQGLLVPN